MIEQFRKALVLAPHTDDGEFGCGGTMARLIEGGAEVTYAAFSTAAKSVPQGFPRDVLKHEVREATQHPRHRRGAPARLRLRGAHVPHRPPGHPRGDDRAAAASSTPTACFMPALVDLHQDHKTIAEEGLRAFKRTTVLAYEIPWNNLNFSHQAYVRLEERHVQKKVEALACYASQQHRNYVREDYIRNVALTRGIDIGCDYAEVFEVYRWIL